MIEIFKITAFAQPRLYTYIRSYTIYHSWGRPVESALTSQIDRDQRKPLTRLIFLKVTWHRMRGLLQNLERYIHFCCVADSCLVCSRLRTYEVDESLECLFILCGTTLPSSRVIYILLKTAWRDEAGSRLSLAFKVWVGAFFLESIWQLADEIHFQV